APARGWLGIEGTDLLVGRAESPGRTGGALVRKVAAGSPAAVVGLDDADVITRVDDTDITSMRDLVVALRDHAPGDTVEITYWHDGDEVTAGVELAQRP
ncbi:MAG: PDZ domain-containing protein, partial [Acidimicrobiales bacterium]|nr:PDZ domain-containing protein [Acidimicrobiales bacterium]